MKQITIYNLLPLLRKGFVPMDIRQLETYETALKKIEERYGCIIDGESAVLLNYLHSIINIVRNALDWHVKSETILSIAAWHEATFPNATEEAQKDKFLDEEREFLSATTPSEAMLELADMFIAAAGLTRWDIMGSVERISAVIDLAKKYNYQIAEFWAAVDYKMKINRGRTWNFENGQYQHKED